MTHVRYQRIIMILLWSLCLSNSSRASSTKDRTIRIINKDIIIKDHPHDKQYIRDLFNYFLTSQKRTSNKIETQEERDLFEQRFRCNYADVVDTRRNLSYTHPHQVKRVVLFWAHEESENRKAFTLHSWQCKRLLLLSQHYCVDLHFVDSLETVERMLQCYHNHEIAFLEIGGHGNGTLLELSNIPSDNITTETEIDQSLWKNKLTKDGSIFLYSCLNGADLAYDNLSQTIARQIRGHVVLGADFSFNATLIEMDRKDPLHFRILQDGKRDGVRAHYYPELIFYENIINRWIFHKDKIEKNIIPKADIILDHLITIY